MTSPRTVSQNLRTLQLLFFWSGSIKNSKINSSLTFILNHTLDISILCSLFFIIFVAMNQVVYLIIISVILWPLSTKRLVIGKLRKDSNFLYKQKLRSFFDKNWLLDLFTLLSFIQTAQRLRK